MGGQHIVDAGEVAQGNKAEDAWEELCRSRQAEFKEWC